LNKFYLAVVAIMTIFTP